MTSTEELRLVEPHDIASRASAKYHARAAWLIMRDKPLLFKHDENVFKIEPAPVKNTIKWLGQYFPLEYTDKSVTITKQNAALYIDYSRMTSEKARSAIYTHALDLCNWIYSHSYIDTFDVTQDVFRTYSSIAAAMTLEFPQERQFLTYSLTTGKRESFTLHTPGKSESHYTLTPQTIMQKTNNVIRKLWTLDTAHNDTDLHDSTAHDVVRLRNMLERYSWLHTTNNGVTAPVCWQYMDSI